MRFLVLGLLLARPHSLYDLQRRFTAGLGHIYAASAGSLHRSLQRLVADGDATSVVDPVARRGRKAYAATDRGRETWRAWMRTPQAGEDVEATTLGRVFLLGLVDEVEERRTILRALRARAIAQQQALDDVEGGTDAYPLAVLDHGLRASALAVAWLDDLLTDLDRS